MRGSRHEASYVDPSTARSCLTAHLHPAVSLCQDWCANCADWARHFVDMEEAISSRRRVVVAVFAVVTACTRSQQATGRGAPGLAPATSPDQYEPSLALGEL